MAFGSAASGAVDTDKHNQEMAAKHRAMDIQAAQNRFLRNQARRAEDRQEKLDARAAEVEDRKFEFDKQKHKDDQDERKAKWRADLKQREFENNRTVKQDKIAEAERIRKNEWEDKQREWEEQDRLDDNSWKSKQRKWATEDRARKIKQDDYDFQHKKDVDDFNLTVKKNEEARRQAEFDEKQKKWEEVEARKQQEKERMNSSFAAMLTYAVKNGDRLDNGNIVLRPEDVEAFNHDLGYNLVGGQDGSGKYGVGGVVIATTDPNTGRPLATPQVMIMGKNGKSFTPMSNAQLRTMFINYPGASQAFADVFGDTTEQWMNALGVNQPDTGRNYMAEGYYKNALEGIDKQIDSYHQNGQDVPQELIDERNNLLAEYRSSAGLGDSQKGNDPKKSKVSYLNDIHLPAMNAF